MVSHWWPLEEVDTMQGVSIENKLNYIQAFCQNKPQVDSVKLSIQDVKRNIDAARKT